jgi:hypothetical protein
MISSRSGSFNYNQDFKHINFRKNPHLYQIGRGEQGVLLVEPYKSEILPYWKFKTPEIAAVSAKKIYQLFLNYIKQKDFVGMDMARKFLQMGYTRSRRYANHPSGQKYETNPWNQPTSKLAKAARKRVLPQAGDWANNEKAESARIFYSYYLMARNNATYTKFKQVHVSQYSK